MTDDEGRHLGAASFTHYLNSAAPIEHPIPGSPRLVLFFDPSNVRVGLRGPAAPGESAPLSGRERLGVRLVHHDEQRMIEIAVTDARLFEDAYPVLCTIADRIQLDHRSMSEAVTETLRRLGHLLEPEGTLPQETELGLLGELSILVGLARATSPDTALAAWRGAAREEHDFGLATLDLEVKTTTAERRAHRISSLTQLVPTGSRPLWLVSLQVTQAGSGGTTLAELITRTRDLFDDEKHRQLFEDQLHRAGWRPRHATTTLRAWRLRTPPALYAVTDTFPRLTPSLLETAGVRLAYLDDIVYSLDLTGLPADPAPAHLADAIGRAHKELV